MTKMLKNNSVCLSKSQQNIAEVNKEKKTLIKKQLKLNRSIQINLDQQFFQTLKQLI